MATRDGTWEVDLIWKYFQETGAAGSPTDDWYKKMDPAGSLDDRKHVYDLLVNEPAHTNPSGADFSTSMIPWNQLNDGIIKTFNTRLACGSVAEPSGNTWDGGADTFLAQCESARLACRRLAGQEPASRDAGTRPLKSKK